MTSKVDDRVPVLIVGGSLVGLSASLFLGGSVSSTCSSNGTRRPRTILAGAATTCAPWSSTERPGWSG